MKQLEEMQERFKCQRCGICCAVGGDMFITEREVEKIAIYLDIPEKDYSRLPVSCKCSARSLYGLDVTRPCFFQDKMERTCMIQDCKPRACKDYPFRLFAQGGCTFDALLVCPEARRMIADMLKEK